MKTIIQMQSLRNPAARLLLRSGLRRALPLLAGRGLLALMGTHPALLLLKWARSLGKARKQIMLFVSELSQTDRRNINGFQARVSGGS